MPNNPRALLKQHNLYPKKQWGQNFLLEQNIIHKIVDLLDPQPTDQIVEFGAGTGALTALLCQRSQHVHAVERDRDLVTLLEAEFADQSIDVIAADAARFDLAQLSIPDKLMLIGNLPYQISSPILFNLLAQRTLLKRVVLMLQKEVVERLAASPQDGKAYSTLSIRFGALFHVEHAFNVSRNCFYPRPKVDSAVVLLEPLADPIIPDALEPTFAALVKAAFASRRKTLHNNLKAAFPDIPQDTLQTILHSANIEARSRGETLSIPAFAQLAQLLHPHLHPA